MRFALAYIGYILKHKWFVFLAGLELGVPIWQLIIHDLSKLSPVEFVPYMNNFTVPRLTGVPASQEVKDAFAPAWWHHLLCGTSNRHHWQCWIIMTVDDGGQPVIHCIEMDDQCKKEMLADWMGAGRALGKPDTLAWYISQRNKMMLHTETRAWIEQKLGYFNDGRETR